MQCQFLFVIFAVLLTGCTKTIYVPVESNSASSVNSSAVSLRIDTIQNCDTVTITLSEKGDTVNNIITRWRTRISTVRDTVSVERTDTVFQKIPVPTPAVTTGSKLRQIVSDAIKFTALCFVVLSLACAVRFYLKHISD